MNNSNVLETQFKQREYDSKWEKIIKILDHENRYQYTNDTGHKMNYIPTKWVVAGVYDMLMEIV